MGAIRCRVGWSRTDGVRPRSLKSLTTTRRPRLVNLTEEPWLLTASHGVTRPTQLQHQMTMKGKQGHVAFVVKPIKKEKTNEMTKNLLLDWYDFTLGCQANFSALKEFSRCADTHNGAHREQSNQSTGDDEVEDDQDKQNCCIASRPEEDSEPECWQYDARNRKRTCVTCRTARREL